MNNKIKQLNVERGQCSFYKNVRVKENVRIDISKFVTAIRNGKWKNETESYRQLIREGKTAEAGRIKAQLPALLVAGCCEGGHTKTNFISLSGMAVVDIDHVEGKARELLETLRKQPWVYAGWLSVSGEGFKVVVNLMAESQQEYEELAYPAVAAHIERLLGISVDMHCKDISRLCYASWDPEAFINENCEVFPWREKEEEEEASSPTQASGFVHTFYHRFQQTHPFVPGKRHEFLLKLGASARRNGMNLEELSLLIKLAEMNLFAPDYAPGEIRRNITDSYRFTEKNQTSKREYSGARVQNGPLAPSSEHEEEEDREEEIRERNQKMRMNAPYLPDWIFDTLPELLKQGIGIAKNNRQRDMLLLSMLTNLSACMPNTRMVYDDTYVYPHLFLAVIASSASGKGIMSNASRLVWEIQKELEAAHKAKQKEYDNALLAWEQERQQALKNKRNPDTKLRPEPFLRETLSVAVNTSRSQLIQLLAGSPQGIILNASEFDTLHSAVKAEYGQFDDLLRACFHHEMFGSDFKTDKRAFIVHTPKMAFCGSGTPQQFYRLCPNLENGAYSRYMIYMAEHKANFLSMAPRGDKENKDKLFKGLAERVLEMYRYLKAYPTEVFFTPEQWELHKSFFESALQGVKMEEVEGPISIVFRCGLIAARIAMVLTTLRKFESQWSFHDITCSDEDFLLSLAIMEVLLSHSLQFATSLQKPKSPPTEMRKYFKVRSALEKLKPEFSYTELIEALNSEGISRSSAKRCRQRLLEMKIIVQQGDSYRFVNRQWRGKFEKYAREWV